MSKLFEVVKGFKKLANYILVELQFYFLKKFYIYNLIDKTI